jgi:hypothetical protein
LVLTKIDQYEVMYSANKFSPRIWLKAGGKFIGTQLVFKPNGAVLPSDSKTSIYYHLDDFQNIIDILRNEKPVYLLWVGTGPGSENGIKTTPEKVGEAEQ